MVQHRGEWVNIRDIYGDYILLCAQFESISKEYNETDSKFLFPIEKFGSELINNKLKRFFLKKFNLDPGRSISRIRAGITHPKGEENEFLSKIHISEINGLSIIMFSIVISKVLIDSGVDSFVTDSYQYRLGIQHLSQ